MEAELLKAAVSEALPVPEELPAVEEVEEVVGVTSTVGEALQLGVTVAEPLMLMEPTAEALSEPVTVALLQGALEAEAEPEMPLLTEGEPDTLRLLL